MENAPDADDAPSGHDSDLPRSPKPLAKDNRSISQSRPKQGASRPQNRSSTAGQRPEHPNGAAALLMIGIVVLLVLIAVFSTFGGR